MPVKKVKRKKQPQKRRMVSAENLKMRVMQFRVMLAINLLLVLSYFATDEPWILFPLVITLPVLFAAYLRSQPTVRKRPKPRA